MRKCLYCGKVLDHWYQKKFCSQACLMKERARLHSRILKCITCGKNFKRPLSELAWANRQHCSNECRKKRTYSPCPICKKEVMSRPSQPRIYCSRSCNAKGRKGKKNGKYKGGVTPNARRVRTKDKYYIWQQLVLKRDNWTCQKCNKRGGKLEVDHIITLADLLKNNPNPFDPNDDYFYNISNGQTLCIPCHKIKTKSTYC